MFRQPLVEGTLLFFDVHTLASREQSPVDLMAVELRPIDTGKFSDAADRNPARATHTGAINHNRVQTDDGFHAEWLGGPSTELHHHCRPDGDDAQELLTELSDLLIKEGME